MRKCWLNINHEPRQTFSGKAVARPLSLLGSYLEWCNALDICLLMSAVQTCEANCLFNEQIPQFTCSLFSSFANVCVCVCVNVWAYSVIMLVNSQVDMEWRNEEIKRNNRVEERDHDKAYPCEERASWVDFETIVISTKRTVLKGNAITKYKRIKSRSLPTEITPRRGTLIRNSVPLRV